MQVNKSRSEPVIILSQGLKLPSNKEIDEVLAVENQKICLDKCWDADNEKEFWNLFPKYSMRAV